MPEPIRAPWTNDQVAALNAYQRAGWAHPFTCGGEHTGAPPVLVAHHDGWRCPAAYCTYRQDWAHAAMIARRAADELDARFAGLRRAMAAPPDAPEEIAAGNAADRAEAERLHRLRPGVPLHHVYAVLQAKREAGRVDAAMRAPADDEVAPLLWAETVNGYGTEGRIGVPVTDTDGNVVGEVSLDQDSAEVLADMLLHILDEDDAEAGEQP